MVGLAACLGGHGNAGAGLAAPRLLAQDFLYVLVTASCNLL